MRKLTEQKPPKRSAKQIAKGKLRDKRLAEMDEFTAAYIEAALWSTNDESDESGGVPLDENYGVEDIDEETYQRMVADCRKFQAENAADIATYDGDYSPEEMAGHDFWLTRNGHGCGFWDGCWQEEVGERLTKVCDVWEEIYLEVYKGTIYQL